VVVVLLLVRESVLIPGVSHTSVGGGGGGGGCCCGEKCILQRSVRACVVVAAIHGRERKRDFYVWVVSERNADIGGEQSQDGTEIRIKRRRGKEYKEEEQVSGGWQLVREKWLIGGCSRKVVERVI
jgi:hypothetical protein